MNEFQEQLIRERQLLINQHVTESRVTRVYTALNAVYLAGAMLGLAAIALTLAVA